MTRKVRRRTRLPTRTRMMNKIAMERMWYTLMDGLAEEKCLGGKVSEKRLGMGWGPVCTRTREEDTGRPSVEAGQRSGNVCERVVGQVMMGRG